MQGDLILPSLFNIVAYIFAILIARVKEYNMSETGI